MEVEAEREAERETEARGEGAVLQLSRAEERDLTAGVKIAAEDADREKGEALTRLESQLEGARENAEREVAWIRRLVPGTATAEAQHDALPDDEFTVSVAQYGNQIADGVDPRHLPIIEDDEVAVEYLLPSGDTFWETHDVPGEYWDGDAEFARLLEATGTPTGELAQLLGSRVPITRQRSDWRLDLDGAIEDSDQADEQEEKTVKAVADTFDTVSAVHFGVLALGSMVGWVASGSTDLFSFGEVAGGLLIISLLFTVWVGVSAAELMDMAE